MSRTILFLAIVIAAAGLPILLSKDGWKWTSESVAPASSDLDSVDRNSEITDLGSRTNPRRSAPRSMDPALRALLSPKAEDTATHSLITPIPEILRFDVTPSHVMRRWSRVSTYLAELEMRGMRVPIVTGVNPQDLHGTATFFFDRDIRMRRITVHGFTGDSEPLIQFVQSMYRLREFASVGERIFIADHQGQPISLLRIRNSPVIAADAPYSQQEVILELNLPQPSASLSSESLAALRRMKNANML
jgi:hypothetical protein